MAQRFDCGKVKRLQKNPNRAINKVASLNIVKSRQGNFGTIFTKKVGHRWWCRVMMMSFLIHFNLVFRSFSKWPKQSTINDKNYRCVGRRCTLGSSPLAFSAPQGAAGSTATPATITMMMKMVTMMMVMMVMMMVMMMMMVMKISPGSHRWETYSVGSDALSQTELKVEKHLVYLI